MRMDEYIEQCRQETLGEFYLPGFDYVDGYYVFDFPSMQRCPVCHENHSWRVKFGYKELVQSIDLKRLRAVLCEMLREDRSHYYQTRDYMVAGSEVVISGDRERHELYVFLRPLPKPKPKPEPEPKKWWRFW